MTGHTKALEWASALDMKPVVKSGRGGRRPGAGRPDDSELRRLVADLCVSLGYQGDARVNPDQIIQGALAYGHPSSKEDERGIRPASVREASLMVARRRLADQPLPPAMRARKEASLAGRIRRAYYREIEEPKGTGFLAPLL